MVFDKFLKDNKLDIDELMSLYMSKSTNDKNGLSVRTNSILYQETVTDEILKRYNKLNQINFQNELKANVKEMFADNLMKRLDKKQELAKKKTNQETEKKTLSTLKKEGLAVSRNAGKTIDIKIEEEGKKGNFDLTEEDIRKEAIKALYEETLDKYYALRERVSAGKNGQVQTGDLDVGDKAGTELVLYEAYLKRINLNYMSKYKIFISEDDKEISEKENKYINREQKNQKVVNYKAEKNLDRITHLNDEINSIAEEITFLGMNSSLIKSEDFDQKMDALQKQYIEKNYELRELSPNMLEMKEQIEKKEELDEFRDSNIGEVYENKYEKKVQNKENYNLVKKEDNIKDKIEENGSKEIKENVSLNIHGAEELLDEAEKIVETDPYKASEIVKSARMMAGIGASTDKQEYEQNLKEEDTQKQEENSNLDSVRAQCTKAVKSKEEILAEDISRIKNEISETREDIEKQKSSSDRIR
jgi:hypothetical protein